MEHGPRYRYALVIHARRSVCECDHMAVHRLSSEVGGFYLK